MKAARIERQLRVKPGSKFRVKSHHADWRELDHLRHLGEDALTDRARAYVQKNLDTLARAQELLYANDTHSVLIVFQAMDAGGKDGMIKHVMSGLNPQGCQVFSFKKPSDEELDHNFLWRYSKCLPERGRIGIFNRSYYEEVLVVRVHPELLDRQRLAGASRAGDVWEKRYEDINHFEHHLVRNGTLILKFFLNVSKKEQKKRFLDRLTNPGKHWKFSPADLAERRFWDDYMKAFEDAITATSTRWAPWYAIPADDKWIARAAVSAIIARAIDSLGLRSPEITPQRRAELAAARKQLESE